MKYSLWTRSVSLLLAVLMVLAIPAAAAEVPESQEDGASTAAADDTAAVQDPFDSSADTVLPEEDAQEGAESANETESPAQEPESPKETEPQPGTEVPDEAEDQPGTETPAVEEPRVYLDEKGDYLAPERLVLTLVSYADGESANRQKMEQYTGVVAFYDYNERDTEKMLEEPYFFYYEKGELQEEEERFVRTDRYLSLASAPTETVAVEGEEAQLVYLAEEVYVDPEAETHPDYLFAFNQAEGENGLYTGGVDGVAYVDGQTFDVPVILSQNETTGGEPTLVWEKQEGATGYQVYRRTGDTESWGTTPLATVGAGENTYTDRTANQTGTTYYYQVKAVKGGAVSGDGAVVSYTCYAIPTVTATAAAGGVQVTWTRDSAATGYRVLRKASNATSWTVAGDVSNPSSGSKVQWQDTGSVSNTTYTYAVRSYYGEKTEDREAYTVNVWSGLGTAASVYYLAAPVLTNVYSSAGGMTVTWSAVAGATQYFVYQKSSASGASWVRKATLGSSARSYTIPGVKAGESYYYTVKAATSTVDGPFYNTSADATNLVTYHGTPVVVTTNVATGVRVSWSKDAAATGYRVYRQVAGTAIWTRVADITKGTTTAYVDTAAVSNKTYSYTVRAYYGAVSGMAKDGQYTTNLWSGYTGSASLLYLAAPKLTAVYSTAGGMTVTWSAVAGATKYYVYQKSSASGAGWARKATLSSSYRTYTISDVKAGESYYYTVKAATETLDGPYYDTGLDKANLVTYHGTPTVTVANIANGIRVSWTRDTAATGYRLYRRASGESAWTTVANITKGTTVAYTDTGVTNNKTYYYTVRAYYGAISGISKDIKYTTNLWSGYTATAGHIYLSVPVLASTCQTTAAGIKVSWTKVAGAAGYAIYRRPANSSKWSCIKTLSSGTTEVYVDTSPTTAGTAYYYTVRAIASNKTLSYFDTTGSYAVYLPAPTLVSALVNSAKGTTVTWKGVSGATGYRIYRRTETGSWQLLTVTVSNSVLTYLDTAVKSNATTYYYTVMPYTSTVVNGKTLTVFGAYDSGITFSIPMSGSGWVKKDGNTYYVKNGFCLTGWQYLSRNGGNYKYYFDIKTGALVTNLYSYFGKSYRNLKCRITVCLNSSSSNPSYNTIYLYDSETDSYCIPAVSVRCVGNLSKTMYSNSSNTAFLKAGTGQRWLDSGSYEQYACYISGTYSWFHSALYFGSMSPNSFSSASYNSMVNNNNNSNGCVRMQCIYAFLIQDIMKNGYGKSNRVNVILKKRTSEAGPFGVPQVDKISSRKTDPTDPAVTGKFFYETSIWGVNAKAGASAWTYY